MKFSSAKYKEDIMNKIGLIISREYLSRVRKKSFVVMTLLGPIFFAAIIFLPAWLATKGGDQKYIQVLDESGLFAESFIDSEEASYVYAQEGSLDEQKEKVLSDEFDGLLYIPELNVENPHGVAFYSSSNPSLALMGTLRGKLEKEIENVKLINSGIGQEVLDGLKADVDISTISLSDTGDETESSSIAASVIGYVASFLIYIFIFVYGAQCMRGVIEEKTSRIIEVMISSVRPFQLMMGKVIGIAGVGLSQFLLWILLTVGITSAAGSIMGKDTLETKKDQLEQLQAPQEESQAGEEDFFSKISASLASINFPMVIVAFLFFFLTGYLLYGALFAAIGSAVDSDADAQQFMLPVTVPLIISIVTLSAILNDPNGSLAFWMSMIPFTSPVVMMMRVPFGVPAWELALSMILMIGGFIFTVWVGSRIYRIGILMHGTKVSFKVLGKWIMMKN